MSGVIFEDEEGVAELERILEESGEDAEDEEVEEEVEEVEEVEDEDRGVTRLPRPRSALSLPRPNSVSRSRKSIHWK